MSKLPRGVQQKKRRRDMDDKFLSYQRGRAKIIQFIAMNMKGLLGIFVYIVTTSGSQCIAFVLHNYHPITQIRDEIQNAPLLRLHLTNYDNNDNGGDVLRQNAAITDARDDNDPIRARSEDEWIDGQQMMQILAREKAEKLRRDEMVSPSSSLQIIDKFDPDSCISRISYTDANTLQIEIPPPGLDSSSIATGAFSALWFGTIAPATISMLSSGLLGPALFMAPFWLAGGVVVKTAIYDPFISSKLSIGNYLWILEKRYLKSTKKEEGSTESVTGATVELAIVVNNVPQYQLRLFVDTEEDGKSITFGKGLTQAELEYLSRVINDHCTARLVGA